MGITVTAIIGSQVSSRVRDRFLSTWLFLGAIATFLLAIVSANNLIVNVFISSFFGASIGMGLPSCLSYFAKSTAIENRGKLGGTIWSTVGFIVLAFAFVISSVGLLEAIIILAIWRLIGGAGFFFLNRTHEQKEVQKSPSYLMLIRKKEILLYLFPWVMFSLINALEAPMLERLFGEQQYVFFQLAEFAFIGIFAFIGGFIADIAGRKRVVIAGFIMLGIEYATMSAFSASSIAIYFFTTLDGITWGLLFSVFFTVIWGDLGENYEKEKFYVLGGLPFLLASFLTILIKPYTMYFPIATAFTVASFFLFVAVIPLMYAPETLPEKAIKDRDLQSYIEKAKKIAEKKEEKNEVKDSDNTKNEKHDEDKESPEDGEARKLAEKYY
jgi:MFS family permease